MYKLLTEFEGIFFGAMLMLVAGDSDKTQHY
jgi:hypothetical protein